MVAFFAGITEINALPPHYRAPNADISEFHPGEGLRAAGLTCPIKPAPPAEKSLLKMGLIYLLRPLGFEGDKAPDIDLNFSGEEDQAAAHHQTTEMFGKDNVFRAGTIGTLGQPGVWVCAQVRESRGIVVSKAEEERLIKGCMDVKRPPGSTQAA